VTALGDAVDVAETRETELKGLAGTHRLHLVPWADVPADG